MKRVTLLAGMCLLIAGCAPEIPNRTAEDTSEETGTESSQPSTPTGGGQGARVSGALGVTTGQDQFDVGQGTAASGNPATAGSTTPAQPKQANTPKPATFAQSDGILVDAREWLARPKVVEVSNRITGSDPLTASMQGLFSIGSKAQILAFKKNLDIQKELNGGRNPTFKEFSQMVQQQRIRFIGVYPWQAIGYDDKEGRLMLLEDKADKIARYKAKGIPIEEADKPYDDAS